MSILLNQPHNTMTITKSVKKQNCLFCDSARHTMAHCPGTFGGRKKKNIDKLIHLYSVERPDFHSYTLKELKIIAYINPFKYSFDMPLSTGLNQKNNEHGYEPIPLTLSRHRMIQALTNRWSGRKTLIEKYNNPPDKEECPICYEPIQHSCWNYPESHWTTHYTYGTVRTLCNHHFCGSCWGKLKRTNENEVYSNYHNEPIVKKCPMCRQETTDVDIWSKD